MNPWRFVLDQLGLTKDAQGDFMFVRLFFEALAIEDTDPAPAGSNPYRVCLDRLRPYGGHGFARLEQLLNTGAVAYDKR